MSTDPADATPSIPPTLPVTSADYAELAEQEDDG